MSQLAYMTKRGAGVVHMGTAAELGARMMRLKTSATLRSTTAPSLARYANVTAFAMCLAPAMAGIASTIRRATTCA